MSQVRIESPLQRRRKRQKQHIARHPKFPAPSHRVNEPEKLTAPRPQVVANAVARPPAERPVTVTANVPPATQTAATTPAPATVDEASAADLALPIEELDLTVRSYNVLKREGVNTVGELVGKSRLDLLDMVRLGEKSIDRDIVPKLADMGLSLKEDTP